MEPEMVEMKTYNLLQSAAETKWQSIVQTTKARQWRVRLGLNPTFLSTFLCRACELLPLKDMNPCLPQQFEGFSPPNQNNNNLSSTIKLQSLCIFISVSLYFLDCFCSLSKINLYSN
ncbi:hypothetical protein L1987_86246 [Smallanthus sonchifolius]|uniref:Uncharacterized protein n=1 Tax=Smallanthus sonchifolius TaxID=185202 RepID=A0ACB8XZ93_9ASTR|nr:hypothetical protein L1987_86246 [Smallanthus sonchifolius]